MSRTIRENVTMDEVEIAMQEERIIDEMAKADTVQEAVAIDHYKDIHRREFARRRYNDYCQWASVTLDPTNTVMSFDEYCNYYGMPIARVF